MHCTKTTAIRPFVAGLILLLCTSCNGENSEREDAEALLARIAAVDLNGPLDLREQQIERLRTLPLRSPAMAGVRDGCARVHAGLLAAEEQQVRARERLGRAKQPVSQAELTAIAAEIGQASQRLQKANAELPACQHATRKLALRFH
jgi:hypothetical protein